MDNSVPTAATDGKHLYINPKWFTDLTPNERVGLLAHEVLHVALDHMHRRGDRDPKLWNVAADFVINDQLVLGGYILPEGGCVDAKYRGKSTEEVYDIIYKKSDKDKKALLDGLKGMNGSDIQYPDQTDPGHVTQDQVTQIILRATTQASSMGQPPGSIPGEVGIELERLLNPPLPWHVILNNYLTEFAKDDYTFRRPNRRFLPDHYLPTAHSEAIANIAVAVDTSCSVSDKQFNTFIQKIDEIQHTMHPKLITVISFDTKLKEVQTLQDNQDAFKELKFQGRGGTNIAPVMKWADENKPTVMLVFTDGEFSVVDPIDKTVPIVWLIHDNPKWDYDYGRVIHYDINT